jgi:hypothetical protein
LAVTGGQVHDIQVVRAVLDTPLPPMAITAGKDYDSAKVRRQIKDEGALPIIPNCCTALKKSLLFKAPLPAAAQDRELLLPVQRLAAYRHPL